MSPTEAVLGLLGGVIGAGLLESWRIVRASRSRPLLEIARDEDSPVPKEVAEAACVYLRLRVSNRAGRDLARNVSVVIEDAELMADGDRQPCHLNGMWLAWSDRELTNPHAERQSEQINPGQSLSVDVVHLNEKVDSLMIVDVRPQPEGKVKPNFFGACRLRLILAVGSDDPRTLRRYETVVDYDGTCWHRGDDVKNHLRMSDPTDL